MAQASKSFVDLKNKPIFVFQNMFVWRSKELKEYMSNNYIRVGLYSKNKTDIPNSIKNTMGGIVDATPKCLDTAILEIQDPREQKLFFIAEEFGRKTKTERYSPKSFDFLKELGNLTKNRIKGNRALIGLTNIASALAPKPGLDKGNGVDPSYFNGVDTEDPKKAPGVDLPLVSVQGQQIQGRIQTMNAKVYDTTNIRQELSSGIPQSIIDSCSVPYVEEYNVRGNNEILNLGKNLFDFESLVHVGYLNSQDKRKWEDFLEDPSKGFLNKENVHPTKNSYDAPNIESLFKSLPKFEYVWAASLHRLILNEYGSLTAPIQKGQDKLLDDAKTVQYALYSNNHTTRLIETEMNAENTSSRMVSTIFPYIRTFESPSLFAWMTKADLEEFKAGLNTPNKTLPKKVQESIVYYRYINQGFVAIGESANVEQIVSSGVENVADALKSAKKQETIVIKATSHQTKGFELTQGGSFAINLFEKNARMLISSDANSKIDALNFVADDNKKFIDVRLPPAFYKKDGKNVRLPIDYAMAYSSNSNVVLLSRTTKDDVINTFDGKNPNQKDNYKKLWLALNQNSDFSVERKTYSGFSWADKVTISRRKCTPMRMLADTHYKLMSNFADKVYYNVDKSGSDKRKERVDKLDAYIAAIQLSICDPSRDLFKTPFETSIEQLKFKSFMNVLRGILFDIKTFFNKDISRFYIPGDKQNPIKGKNMTEASTDFKVLPNTKDFLPAIDTNKPDDLGLGLSSSKDNKINKQLFFDSAFYSNSVKDNLQPINLPLARPEDKTKKYKLAKFWPTDSSASDREYGRSLYVRTNATVDSRIEADANAGHNVIALAPFIDGAPKAISDIKKVDMRGIVPKVINLSDMESVLDCLHFYHKAAVGVGSLNGGLDDGSQKDGFSIKLDPFLINPYTGTYTTDANILKDCTFDASTVKVRAYESFVNLRKEYYALRFVALLSCCFEDLNTRDVKIDTQGTSIVFETAFAKMCKVFFGDKLRDVNDTDARNYFLSLLGLNKQTSDKDIGLNFQKLVFFENSPFARIVKRNHRSATFFKYEDSPFELSRVYYTDPSVRKQVDEDFQRPYTYDVAYEQAKASGIVLPENKNSEEAKELTKTYYASLSKQSQLEIYKTSQDRFNAQQTFLNSIMLPGLGIPKEWKDFICAKGKGMPMPTPKDGDKFLESIAKTWQDVGLSEKDVFANLCDSNFEIDKTAKVPTPTTPIKQVPIGQGRQMTFQNTESTKQDVEKDKDTKGYRSKVPMLVGGAVAISALAYLGYKYLGNKEKK